MNWAKITLFSLLTIVTILQTISYSSSKRKTRDYALLYITAVLMGFLYWFA
jgi:hypothetical protein